VRNNVQGRVVGGPFRRVAKTGSPYWMAEIIVPSAESSGSRLFETVYVYAYVDAGLALSKARYGSLVKAKGRLDMGSSTGSGGAWEPRYNFYADEIELGAAAATSLPSKTNPKRRKKGKRSKRARTNSP
jgi:hypothetical protein